MTVSCCVFETTDPQLGDIWSCTEELTRGICIQRALALGSDRFHAGPDGSTCKYSRQRSQGPDEDAGGCYRCIPDDPFSDPFVSCCYNQTEFFDPDDTDPSIALGSFLSNCLECGGEPNADPATCFVPDTPDCIEAPPDEFPGAKWTIDQNAVVALALAPAHSDGGDLLMMTANPIRAGEVVDADNDPCVHVTARDVMLSDGFVYSEICTQPDRDPVSKMTTYAKMMTVSDPRLEDGFQYDVGVVALPKWTEAIYRSRTWRCSPPVN